VFPSSVVCCAAVSLFLVFSFFCFPVSCIVQFALGVLPWPALLWLPPGCL
jgi:hypothetical protein